MGSNQTKNGDKEDSKYNIIRKNFTLSVIDHLPKQLWVQISQFVCSIECCHTIKFQSKLVLS